MKKLFAMILALMMVLCLFAGCGEQTPDETTEPEDPTVVNLMDMYTVKDPEGVEYDKRVALYMPILETEETYAIGHRSSFCVLYGKEGKGVYMYSVDLFETADQAASYAESGGGTADGLAVVSESNADFFAAMESFIPDLQTWIDNMMMSGMMELD